VNADEALSPDDHGVYDTLETKAAPTSSTRVTSRSIKARTFLDDLTAAGQIQLARPG
jgi:hypothetical protein